MRIGNFIVDTDQYEYLEPLWPVLENHPNGISIDDALAETGLDHDTMLKHIEKLAGEYQKKSMSMLKEDMLKNIIQSCLSGEKTDDIIVEDMASSWLFDKVMLYDRVYELRNKGDIKEKRRKKDMITAKSLVMIFWIALGVLSIETLLGIYYGLTINIHTTITVFSIFLGGLMIAVMIHIETMMKEYMEKVKTYGK